MSLKNVLKYSLPNIFGKIISFHRLFSFSSLNLNILGHALNNGIVVGQNNYIFKISIKYVSFKKMISAKLIWRSTHTLIKMIVQDGPK